MPVVTGIIIKNIVMKKLLRYVIQIYFCENFS